MVFRRSSSAGAGLHLLLKAAHLRKSERGGGSGPASALENSTFERWGEKESRREVRSAEEEASTSCRFKVDAAMIAFSDSSVHNSV